jgi:hypothetical protein
MPSQVKQLPVDQLGGLKIGDRVSFQRTVFGTISRFVSCEKCPEIVEITEIVKGTDSYTTRMALDSAKKLLTVHKGGVWVKCSK